jgi:nucleoid-associated protein YgaU
MIERPVLTFALTLVLFVCATVVLYRNPRLARTLEDAADAAAGAPGAGSQRALAERLEAQAAPEERAHGAAAPSGPRAPLRTYTLATKGESVADIAERVYGSRRYATELWRANRDQLASASASLAEGSVLRTPAL